MLSTLSEIRRLFLSPIVGVFVFVLAILSYAIGDRFTAGEFAPWLVFPALVALFFILSPQAWLRALLYAAAGLIAAQVVMALLGFERHGMMSDAGYHSTTVVLHILFEVGVDIALAIGFVAMLKRIAPHTYEGNIIATYDVERVLNWRLAAVLLALPFYVFAVRFIEAALAGAIFGMSFEAWSVLGADLVGYFMFLPAIVGIVLALTGAPRLEPDYQPLWILVVGYVALTAVLTKLGVLFGSQVPGIVMIVAFGIPAILVTLFPTTHLAGRLLLVNYAGFIIASQYSGLTVTELTASIIGISVVVVLVMLLRVIAQVKMNRANARVHSALERSDVFLRAGTGAYIIHNEDFRIEYLSDPMKEMIGIEDGETVTSVPQNLLGLSQEQTAAMRQQLSDMKSDAIYRDEKIYDFYPLKGSPKKVKIVRRWILDPITQTRFMSATYEDVTDKLRLEAERADQEEVLKAFVYEGPQYCFVEDEEFKIRLMSEGAAELIAGRPSADLIGKDALEYFSLEDQKRIAAARSERDDRLERGETVMSNTPITFKRGEETVKVRIQVKLLHLPSGAVMRGIIFDDITEVETARQRAENYLNAGTSLFFIRDEDFELEFISEPLIERLGYASFDEVPP